MRFFRKRKGLTAFISIYFIYALFVGDVRDSHAITGLTYSAMTAAAKASPSFQAGAGIVAAGLGVCGVMAASASAVASSAVIPLACGAAGVAWLASAPVASSLLVGLGVGIALVAAYQGIRSAMDGPAGASYPALKAAAGSTLDPTRDPSNPSYDPSSMPAGAVIQLPNGNKYLTTGGGIKYSSGFNVGYGGSWVVDMGVYPDGSHKGLVISADGSGAGSQTGVLLGGTGYHDPANDPISSVPKTDAQIQSGIAPGGVIPSSVAGDINNGIKNGDIPVVAYPANPDGTANTQAGPITPAQLDAARNAALAGAKAQAAGSAAIAAQTAAASAQAAADQAKANAAADPTNTALAQTAANAQARADSAAAAAATAAAAAVSAENQLANTATDPGVISAGQNTYDTNLTPPDKSDISALLRSFINASPLVTLVKSFTIDSSNANSLLSFNFHGHSFTADFGNWNSILAAVGGALLSVSHGIALFIVFRRQ